AETSAGPGGALPVATSSTRPAGPGVLTDPGANATADTSSGGAPEVSAFGGTARRAGPGPGLSLAGMVAPEASKRETVAGQGGTGTTPWPAAPESPVPAMPGSSAAPVKSLVTIGFVGTLTGPAGVIYIPVL